MSAIAWPEGAEPLAPKVKAPPALAARLAHIAVVAREDGGRLQKLLPTGARLVSVEGDLWRWDGFVARADAPKPAAIRMEQKTRLAEVEAEIEALSPKAGAARQALVWADRPGRDDLCAGPAHSRRIGAVAIRFKSGGPT